MSAAMPSVPVAFSPSQQAFLDAVAAGASRADAARAANVHRSTPNTWEHNVPGFRDAVESAASDYRAGLASQMRRLSVTALHRLEALLDDPKTPASVCFRAIQMVLTRPRFPDKEWALPENLNPEPIQRFQEQMTILEAETKASMQYEKLRKHAGSVENVGNVENVEFDHGSKSAEDVENVECVEPAPGPQAPSIARNAPCPCGSGQKHKRCCGKNAPPQLHTRAAA